MTTTTTGIPAAADGLGHRAYAALSESERYQVGEARDLLARWDRERGGPGIYSTERTLADRLRGMLALADQLGTELASLRALAAPAFDEAADDRDQRARYARHEGRGEEAQEHTEQARLYRQARDGLMEGLPQAAGRGQA